MTIVKLFRVVGLELIRFYFHRSEDALLKKILDQFEMDFVIDVRANVGIQLFLRSEILKEASYSKQMAYL